MHRQRSRLATLAGLISIGLGSSGFAVAHGANGGNSSAGHGVGFHSSGSGHGHGYHRGGWHGERRVLHKNRDMRLTSVHGFAGVSDATRAPDGKSSLSLFIWSLHAFIASLYERLLLADIRFLMQPTICTII
jgi:hypothetical protein